MSLIPPSINMVMLSGVLQAQPKRSVSADGGIMVEMVVSTGVDGRTVKHAVRVLDPKLSDGALSSLEVGALVTVTGELDYDSTGCFIAVLDRRACDVRFVGSSAQAAAEPVRSETRIEVKVEPKAQITPRPLQFSPKPTTVSAPVVVEAAPETPPVETPVVDEPVEEDVPLPEETAVVEHEPPADDPVPEPVEEAKPVVSAPRRMGFNLGGPKPAAEAPAPTPSPAPRIGLGGLGGLKTAVAEEEIPEDRDEGPIEPQRSSTQPPPRTPVFGRTQSNSSSRPVPSLGADADDDEIPF